MPKNWQLQDAKNRLSEVISAALTEGPQLITRHGKKTAVILSLDDYRRLAIPKTSLLSFFVDSPLKGANLETDRNADTGREVSL